MVLELRRAAFFLALGWLNSATPARPLQQPPFTVTTRVVYVDVVALDADRRPIGTLTAADFEIREDGKPRPVVAFTRVDLGDGALSSAEVSLPHSVQPTSATPEWPSEGRLVVLFFDRTMPTDAVPTARLIASAAIKGLAPGDMATVVRAGPFTGAPVIPEFTNHRARLLRVVSGHFMGMTTAPQMTPGGLRESLPNRQNQGDCWCGTCSYDDLRGIAEALRDVSRLRKLLFFIGSDMTHETSRGSQCIQPIRDAKRHLHRALGGANLTVHTFDPLGLSTDTAGAGSLPGRLPAGITAWSAGAP